eukprot:858450-Rhodomonas_salina.2
MPTCQYQQTHASVPLYRHFWYQQAHVSVPAHPRVSATLVPAYPRVSAIITPVSSALTQDSLTRVKTVSARRLKKLLIACEVAYLCRYRRSRSKCAGP